MALFKTLRKSDN